MSLLPSLPTASGTKLFFSQLGTDVYDTSLTLFKIMIPAIIIVKIAQELGAIDLLAEFIEPLMSGLGLPENVGLVWAMTIATNLYGGMIVLADLDTDSMSIAQMSVLGCLVLTVHGLPVEVAVAKKAGECLDRAGDPCRWRDFVCLDGASDLQHGELFAGTC